MRSFLFCVLMVMKLGSLVYAFGWNDLWSTKDQQALEMMEKGQFKEAEDVFLRKDWRAASAYRAGDYQRAEAYYREFQNEDAYYNQANALAHLGRYEKAIEAYNKTLQMNPENQDALHNRKIVEELLKKQQQNQQNQSQQNQDQQQNQQNQSQQNQDQQQQNQQNQSQQNQDQQQQNQQNQSQQNQDQQQKNQQDQGQKKQDQQQQNQDKANQEPAAGTEENQQQRENQQVKDQLLNLIPDDPGGLLKNKFWRDHLRRELR